MKTFEFKLYGGFTVKFHKDYFEIDVKGVKGLFFQRVKPRHQEIRYEDLRFIDYKDAGLSIGYVRFVTPEIEEYPSSQFVAEVDVNSIIFEKDEKEKFEELMMYLRKRFPQMDINKMKM